MFCPNCGRDNPPECKFCVSCRTNLEVVSRALYTNSVGLLTRMDTALNQLIARYAERVFKGAPATALSRKVSDSWKILGEGFLACVTDFVVFWLMLFAVLPVRLLTLLISTPFRLLIDRSSRPKALPAKSEGRTGGRLQKGEADEWSGGSAVSVVEHTTERLPNYRPPQPGRDG